MMLQLTTASIYTEEAMYDDLLIKIRIDEEGFTHVTITEYDEDGRELVYTEHENFATA